MLAFHRRQFRFHRDGGKTLFLSGPERIEILRLGHRLTDFLHIRSCRNAQNEGVFPRFPVRIQGLGLHVDKSRFCQFGPDHQRFRRIGNGFSLLPGSVLSEQSPFHRNAAQRLAVLHQCQAEHNFLSAAVGEGVLLGIPLKIDLAGEQRRRTAEKKKSQKTSHCFTSFFFRNSRLRFMPSSTSPGSSYSIIAGPE